MVSTILKVLSQEIPVGVTGTDFNGNTLIRVYNNRETDESVLVKSGATTTGSFTLRASETVFVRKLQAETIEATDDLRMVPIAF